MQEHRVCKALMTLPTLCPPVSLLRFLRGGWLNTLTDKTRGLERTNALPKAAQPTRNRAKAQSQSWLAASPKITLGALEGGQGDPNLGSSSCTMYPEWCVLVDPTRPWPPSLPSVSGRSMACVHPKSVSPFYALGSYDIRVSCPNGCLKDLSGPLSGRGQTWLLRCVPLYFMEGQGAAAYGEHRSWNVWASDHRDGAQTGGEMGRPRAGWPGVSSFPHAAMFWGGALRSLRIPAGTCTSWLF